MAPCSTATLLCVFVHGFKGDDDTFAEFPTHLQALLRNALASVEVRIAVYPKFETRGELSEAVARFRDWLQTQVIDIEVEKQTRAPTIHPSVQVALIGHSMGGIVIADALIAIAGEEILPSQPDSTCGGPESNSVIEEYKSTSMFPRISCLLAFDTPFLGINPSALAHGVEAHYTAATSAYSMISSLWPTVSSTDPQKAAPISTSKTTSAAADLSAPQGITPIATSRSWSRSLTYGAGALGAAGLAVGAAYASRTHLSAAVISSKSRVTTGYEFVSSHLLFVSALMKTEGLQERMKLLKEVRSNHQVAWGCAYTTLGKTAQSQNPSTTRDRDGHFTFCNLPMDDLTRGDGTWIQALNDKAANAVAAHMAMFIPSENPNYYALAEKSKELIVSWSVQQ